VNILCQAMREQLYPTNLPPEANLIWQRLYINAADGVVAMALVQTHLPPTSIIMNIGVSGDGYMQPRFGTDGIS
jgi:hypothetical protein